MKTCRICNQSKTLTDFYKNCSMKDGLQSRCKSCDGIKSRKWVSENIERRKENDRRKDMKKYGITVDQYEVMLETQLGVCKICGDGCGTGKRLAVDHCHKNGKVRGLLCARCNTTLGKMNDDPEMLRAAAVYLDQHSA